MRVPDEDTRFPTRSYPYSRSSGVESALVIPSRPPGGAYRFRVGLEQEPVAIEPAELAGMDDLFAQLVLRAGRRPATMHELDATIAAHSSERRSFMIAEGALLGAAPILDPNLRMLVAYRRATEWDAFVSTAPPFDDEKVFLQLIAWSARTRDFSFWERREGSWFLAGRSADALAAPTRGLGPFDSHVNGTLIMKELKAPWLHWHSMSQTLPLDVVPGHSRGASDPIFAGLSTADRLEPIVRRAAERWAHARLDDVLAATRIEHPDRLLRHLLTPTTVNIVSSPATFAGPDDELIGVPPTLFADTDALIDLIGLAPAISRPPFVSRGRYRAAATRLGLHLRNGTFRQDGDAFFAWPVPERSLEDQTIVKHLLARGLLSPQLVATVLMLDFTNPLDSPRRRALLEEIPSTPIAPSDLEPALAAALANAGVALEAGWEAAFSERIAVFVVKVQTRLDSDDGLDDMIRLTDARRRAFRRRKLAEFDLTLPWLDAEDGGGELELDTDARIRIR